MAVSGHALWLRWSCEESSVGKRWPNGRDLYKDSVEEVCVSKPC